MHPGLKCIIRRICNDFIISRGILPSRIMGMNISFLGPVGFLLATYCPEMALLNSQLTSAGQSASCPQEDTWKVNNICFTGNEEWLQPLQPEWPSVRLTRLLLSLFFFFFPVSLYVLQEVSEQGSKSLQQRHWSCWVGMAQRQTLRYDP